MELGEGAQVGRAGGGVGLPFRSLEELLVDAGVIGLDRLFDPGRKMLSDLVTLRLV